MAREPSRREAAQERPPVGRRAIAGGVSGSGGEAEDLTSEYFVTFATAQTGCLHAIGHALHLRRQPESDAAAGRVGRRTRNQTDPGIGMTKACNPGRFDHFMTMIPAKT